MRTLRLYKLIPVCQSESLHIVTCVIGQDTCHLDFPSFSDDISLDALQYLLAH